MNNKSKIRKSTWPEFSPFFFSFFHSFLFCLFSHIKIQHFLLGSLYFFSPDFWRKANFFFYFLIFYSCENAGVFVCWKTIWMCVCVRKNGFSCFNAFLQSLINSLMFFITRENSLPLQKWIITFSRDFKLLYVCVCVCVR